MKKRVLSLICALALCLSLLPATALAAAPNGQVIYVGNENVTSGGYWTTDSNGNVTAYTGQGTPTDNYIYYDADTNTLTLYNATIKKGLDYDEDITGGTSINDAAIGVFNQSGAAELTIILYGSNTIAEVGKGIYVLAISQSTGSSSLTIMGNGSLDTSSSQTGIWVQSNSNDAVLSIKNAKVTATIVDSYGSDGVRVQSEGSFSASLTVDGGSLTATGSGATFAGIQLLFGSGGSVSGTPTVTVSNNAIVRANGGIANNSSTPIQFGTGSDSTGGIVWNGSEGTVYGDVTLQEDLEIGEGETLTIPEDSSLDMGGNEITVESGGKLEGTPTGDGTVKAAPTITTESPLPDGMVGTPYHQALTATGDPTITWSLAEGTLPEGLKLENGAISGTPTKEGTSTFTLKAQNGVGSHSRTFTLRVKPVSVTGVTLNKTQLSLIAGDSETLIASVAPDNATNKAVFWSSDNETVATVDQSGRVTAVGAGTATITVTTGDGGYTASCKVTVSDPVYSIEADALSFDFGSAVEGTLPEQIISMVITLCNTGNQPLEIQMPQSQIFDFWTESPSAGLAPGEEINIFIKPIDELAAGYYQENITFTGVNGQNHATCDLSLSVTVKHSLTQTEAKAPTCTEEGHQEYWYCETCGKYFSDGEGKEEITQESTVLSALGHDYKDGACTRCGAKDPDYVPPTEPEGPAQTGESALLPVLAGLMILSAAALLWTGRKRQQF